jgi:hypothetical protein
LLLLLLLLLLSLLVVRWRHRISKEGFKIT